MCSTRELMYSGSLLSLDLWGIMGSRVKCPSSKQATNSPLPKPLWTQSTSSLIEGWKWMEHTEDSLDIYSRTSIISCAALLKYLISLVLIVFIFLG